jgi:hypothetical protein
MLTCSLAQGGLITFLPLAVPGAALLVAAALFVSAAGMLAGRAVAGRLVDRHGLGGRLLLPGVLLVAVGMALEVVALGGAAPLVVVGAAIVGIGFGLVQNDALTTLFATAGSERYGAASAAWNIAYDAGTGAGALGLGAVADPLGFRAAFGLSALLLVAARRSPAAAPRRAQDGEVTARPCAGCAGEPVVVGERQLHVLADQQRRGQVDGVERAERRDGEPARALDDGIGDPIITTSASSTSTRGSPDGRLRRIPRRASTASSVLDTSCGAERARRNERSAGASRSSSLTSLSSADVST